MVAPPLFACLLLAVPIGAYLMSRRFSEEPEARGRTAARCGALFLVGLAIATPFLTRRAVGTGEAYNYSLSLADGIAQLRSGEVPPLVGQTEYAFNGRIHPLRNAPYLFYLAGGFDLLTFHRLSAWELQNISLAFSLLIAVFSCYGGLRWGTGCGRPTAFLFAIAYGLSPAVLASAYTANLFMTIHAAAFVPLALGACFRQCRHPSRLSDVLMAASLAAVWLAHPPVAYWLTLSLGIVRGLIFLRYPTWSALGGLAGAAVLWSVLAGFVLASVTTLDSSVGFFSESADFGTALMPILRSAFPGCLLPVARSPNTTAIADFQLGYVGCFLLLLLIIVLIRPRAAIRRKPRIYWAIVGSVASALLLLSLAIPVPWLTVRLWNHSPAAAQSLTNVWPMQRVYLVATGLILFGMALALPRRAPAGKAIRLILYVAIALGMAWAGWEARPFISRGLAMRWSADDTARSHLSSNIDLTVTAYSFLGTPPTFVNGVMDPQFEFRLLRDGQDEIDSPFQAALRTAPVIARGTFALLDRPRPGLEVEPHKLTLQPGRRYLLTFSFKTPPLHGRLNFSGPSLSRRYILPSAGDHEGFGMAAGNRRTLSLWTSQDRPEEIEIRFQMDDWPGRPPGLREFAEFTLQEVDIASLPVRLDGLLPLRFTVDAPDANDYVDTPRRWLPGYVAIINGRALQPLRSPIWDVMVPVPKGRSTVELRYVGHPLVRGAFWLSAAGWLGFMIWAGGRIGGTDWGQAIRLRFAKMARWLVRHRFQLAGAVLVLAATGGAIARWASRAAVLGAVGPVRVTFYLPFHESGRKQPIVATGRSGAGSTVFIHYLDEGHVRVGADIWGSSYESDPIDADYFRQQNLVLDSSALYPLDHPRVQALPPAERDRLRGELRVELNGRVALDLSRSAYDSKITEIAVGKNTIGSSGIEPRFDGEILRVKRLPYSRQWILIGGEVLRLRVRFPAGHVGITEPLLTLGPDGRDGSCGTTYLGPGRLRLSIFSADGRTLWSAERTVARDQSHEMVFALSQPMSGRAEPAVQWRVDGEPLFGAAEMPPLRAPEVLAIGLAPPAASRMDSRFTGSELDVESPAPNAVPPANGSGPMRIVAILPKGRTGRQDPLVSTGRSGRGDFVYVVYLDEHHIRLGFDHWGVSGGLSGPIEVDYSAPHDFTISLGSLYPDEADPAWGNIGIDVRRRLKSGMTILLDGREVLKARFDAYPSAPGDITAGLNRIGGSSCDPAFSGVLYSVNRLGLPGSQAR